jgi:hypothetical protein
MVLAGAVTAFAVASALLAAFSRGASYDEWRLDEPLAGPLAERRPWTPPVVRPIEGYLAS